MSKHNKKQMKRAPEPVVPSLNTTSASAAASLGSLKTSPTREQIQQRAYELYVAGGCIPGHDLDNWLQAERDLS